MDTATQQLMYRAFIVTFCVTTGLILLFMMGSAVVLGDGEAIKIIDALKPVAIGNIAAMATAITAHQVASASVSRAQAQAGAVPPPPPPPPPPLSVAPAPAPVVLPASAPAPAASLVVPALAAVVAESVL